MSMPNVNAPPFFGAIYTEADPEGHDSNFLWDDAPYRMLPVSNNRPFVTGLTAQGSSNSCVSRSFREAVNTLTNRLGRPLDMSWSAAYMGGWAQLHGGLGWPMPMNPDPGLAGGALPLLQWAALHGCLTTEEAPLADFEEPSMSQYVGSGRTIDFAEIARQHLLPAIRGACNMGLPVMLDMWVAPEFFNVAGPFDTHIAQYNRPAGVAPVPPNLLHNIVAMDIDTEGVISTNHSGPSYGEGGLVKLDFATILACCMRAFVITRVGSIVAPAVPEVLIKRPCPGKEALGAQWTLNVSRAVHNAFFDPAYGDQQQRAAGMLAAMTEYGVSREDVCFCVPVERETLDAFLAIA